MNFNYLPSIEFNHQVEIDKAIIEKGCKWDFNIVIRGKGVSGINGVTAICGNVGLIDSVMQELGSVEKIDGDFWVSNHVFKGKLRKFDNLKSIGGNLYLKHSSIVSLGSIETIGGNLNIRDSDLKSLGSLKSVKGHVYLNRDVKHLFVDSEVEVGGKLKYYKKTIKAVPLIDNPTELVKTNVAFWKKQMIFGAPPVLYKTIEDGTTEPVKEFYWLYKTYFPNTKCLVFYNTFKESFLKGEYLELEGVNNYLFALYFDMIREFKQKDSTLIDYLEKLSKYYPEIHQYSDEYLANLYFYQDDFKKSWEKQKGLGRNNLGTAFKYELLGLRTIDSSMLLEKGKSNLTNYGIENIREIKELLDDFLFTEEFKGKTSYFYKFVPFLKLPISRTQIGNAFSKIKEEMDFYRGFIDEDQFCVLMEYDNEVVIKPDEEVRFINPPIILLAAIESDVRKLIREIENSLRKKRGVPLIGQGWISETELFNKVSDSFPKVKVLQHQSPKWLGRQHLDIYIPEYNIGIEYQGKQHYEPIDFFGGEEAFIKTVERDKQKQLLCKENNCNLICVDEGYSFSNVFNKINSIIKQGPAVSFDKYT